MREIKFRVWDKAENEFSDISEYDSLNWFARFKEFKIPETLTIQQYTGLKDRNGVDIYEGDIVRCKSFDGWLDQIGYHYNMEVKYQTLESGDSELSGFLYINIDREVIGNIFENPELLKS